MAIEASRKPTSHALCIAWMTCLSLIEHRLGEILTSYDEEPAPLQDSSSPMMFSQPVCSKSFVMLITADLCYEPPLKMAAIITTGW